MDLNAYSLNCSYIFTLIFIGNNLDSNRVLVLAATFGNKIVFF